MKKLRKYIISMCLTLALLATTSPSLVSASTNKDVQYKKNIEISEKNIDKVFEDAVSKQKITKDNDVKYMTAENEKGKKFLIKAFKVDTIQLNDNTYEDIYVTCSDQKYVQPVSDEGKPIVNTFNATTNEGYDDSVSVKAYIKLTYTVKPGTNNYLLTNVEGNWYIADRTVSVSNREVLYACVSPLASNQNVTKYPNGNTFSYATGFTKYVESTSMGHGLGAIMKATLKHGTSSVWNFTFSHSLFGSPYDM